MLQVVDMRLFGRKKKKAEPEVTEYEIFGGATVSKVVGGYEVTWRSPNLTTIRLTSKPHIDSDVSVSEEGDTIRILSNECKLKIMSKDGETEAYISKL